MNRSTLVAAALAVSLVAGGVAFATWDDSPPPVPVVTLPGVTAAAIGDSNTDRNGPWGHVGAQYTPQAAWFHLAATRAGQRVRLTDNFSLSDTRADEMLAEQLPRVLALSPLPEVVSVMSGSNDIRQGRSADHVIESLDATYDELTKRDILVIAGTVLPSDEWDDPAELAAVRRVNEWIRARAGIEVVDYNALLSDGGGAPKAGLLVDGLHISPRGAALMGRELATLLEQLFPAVDVFPSEGSDLVMAETVEPRADGVDVSVTSGFAPGDTVVGLVEFVTDPGADTSTRQIEASLAAVGTSSTAGVFTDTPGYDGVEVALTTVPRTGVLMTTPLDVLAGTTEIAFTVRVTGGEVAFHPGRISLVKVAQMSTS